MQNTEPSHQIHSQKTSPQPIINNQNQIHINSKFLNQKLLKPNAHIANPQNAELNQISESSHQIQSTSPIFACPHPKLGQAFPPRLHPANPHPRRLLQPPKPKPNPIRQTPPHPSSAHKTNHRHPHRHPHPRIFSITNPHSNQTQVTKKRTTTTSKKSAQAKRK